MSKELKEALRSPRDMDCYLEVHSSEEIISHVKELDGCEELRDQFAIAALQGCLAYSHLNETWGDYHNNGTDQSLAERCYRLADAMVSARRNGSIPSPERNSPNSGE